MPSSRLGEPKAERVIARKEWPDRYVRLYVWLERWLVPQALKQRTWRSEDTKHYTVGYQRSKLWLMHPPFAWMLQLCWSLIIRIAITSRWLITGHCARNVETRVCINTMQIVDDSMPKNMIKAKTVDCFHFIGISFGHSSLPVNRNSQRVLLF